jgi:hypothetical protein
MNGTSSGLIRASRGYKVSRLFFLINRLMFRSPCVQIWPLRDISYLACGQKWPVNVVITKQVVYGDGQKGLTCSFFLFENNSKEKHRGDLGRSSLYFSFEEVARLYMQYVLQTH